MTKITTAKQVIYFFFIMLLLALLMSFFVHTWILKLKNLPPYDHFIYFTYLFNFLITIIIFCVLYVLRNKYKDQLGFLFMFGSMLKFAGFFIFFYPVYQADGKSTKLEFFAFFIPYLMSLLVETISLSKLLNLPKNLK